MHIIFSDSTSIVKSGQFPVNLSQCQQTRGIQAMQKDELNDKAEPQFLEPPWILCKSASSRPCDTKPLPASDSIYLRTKRKLLSWLRDYCR